MKSNLHRTVFAVEPHLPHERFGPARRPSRIVIVTETYDPEVNGVALTLGHLVSGLRERGHDVDVVRPRRPSDPRAVSGTILVGGLPVPAYPGVRFGLPARRLLERRWATSAPDAVYVATQGPLGWSAVRVARRLGIRVVSGYHTRFDAYVGHYRLSGAARVVGRYLRHFHNGTSCTLVPTLALKDQLTAAGFANVRVLGRGVDTALFDPSRRSTSLRRAWGAGAEDLVALYVGRIAQEKNVGLAVEAYRAMQASRPGTRFVLVGDGPLRASLQAAHPDLVFAGAQHGERLTAHYASADVFLFPSETETYGNVVPEAMASGLPVVAYDDAAARTLVVPGDSGFVVPRGNPRAFVGAAVVLARAPHALPSMRRHARQAVAALDWNHVVDRFLELLRNTDDELLATGRSTSR